jgi:ABC-2 type transport system ATP-binding protein
MIQLIELSKLYRGLAAVDRIDLQVPSGVIFGFIGPNGAGKTTTLRMMAGVLQPTSGRILIGGRDLAREPEAAKRMVGYVPDRPYIYDKLSGREFLELVAALYELGSETAWPARLAALLELFGLAEWGDELVESYSHGMKQRLVMCAALLPRPRALVVDEPMVGLDPQGAKLLKELFRAEARRGTTVFMSTHSLQVAEEVCDELAIVQAGRLIFRGTVEELRAQTGEKGNLETIYLKLTGEEGIAHGRALSAD